MAYRDLLLCTLLLTISLLPYHVVSEEETDTQRFARYYKELKFNTSMERRPRLSAETYAKLSQPCGRHMKMMEAATQDPDTHPWVTTWLNSYGQMPGPGAELRNPFEVGSYDQCYDVKATGKEIFFQFNNGTNTSLGIHDFGTHYCKGTYRFKDYEIPVGISEGWCVVESCGPEDIKIMMSLPFSYNSSVEYAYCGEKQPIAENPGAIVALLITLLFVGLVLVATIFDCVEKRKKASDETTNYELPEIEVQNGKSTANPDGETVTYTNATDAKAQPNAAVRALISFSLYRTLPTVLDTGGSRAAYKCFNGLRFLAMAWIILGHTWQLEAYVLPDPKTMLIENYWGQFDYIRRFGHMIINNMELAVEIFLFLSATLVTMSLIKTFDKLKDVNHCGRFKEILLYVLHRYWRLTPLAAAVILLYANLWQYWGSGPLYPETYYAADSCKTWWWNNLLYIQNLNRGYCMGWTWYLAIDFQYYVSAPVFAVLLYWKPVVGGVYLAVNWAVSLAIRAFLFSLTQDKAIEYWMIYVKPYSRFGPYAQGIAMGYFIYRTKCKVKLHKAVVGVGWFVAFILTFSIVFGAWGIEYRPKGLQVFYHAVKRDIFTIGLVWTVFACLNGYGGWINTFLSWNVFTPLSKLTYCAYLIHPIVHFVSLANRRTALYVEDSTMIYQFLGNLCLTLICSLGLTLVFEVPFLALEKVILPSRKK